jgi:hypothetical protein
MRPDGNVMNRGSACGSSVAMTTALGNLFFRSLPLETGLYDFL